MRRKLCVLLSILFVLISVPAFSAEASFPAYGETENFGRGSWSAEAHSGAICYNREGIPLLVYGTQGGHIQVTNFQTGEVIHDFMYNDSYIYANIVVTASDGKVYIQAYPSKLWKVYDPINERLDTLEMLLDNGTPVAETNLQGAIATEDGRLYIGEYRSTGAKIYEYNIHSGKTVDHGALWEKAQYIKALSITDKYLYAGVGIGQDIARIFQIDLDTWEKKEFFQNSGGGIIYSPLSADNGFIVASTNLRAHIVDENTLQPIDSIECGSFSLRNPVDMDTLYFSGNQRTKNPEGIYEYHIETKEYQKVAEAPFSSEDIKFMPWAELPNGDWVLPMRTALVEQVGYYNPRTQKAEVFTVDNIPAEGPAIQSLEISSEGIIYIGGYQSSMGVYNINDNTFLFSIPSWHQNEGVGFLNGKTYFGVYTDALIYGYDPAKPINYKTYYFDKKYQGSNVNPAMMFDIEDDQDRPFVVKGYKDKLYVGTMAGYAQLGGALVIYQEDEAGNPSAQTFRHVVKDQSITGIAVKDNLVYIGGTVRGGLGITPTETEAKISVFDTDKNEVITTITPDLPIVGTSSKTIGELSFGPDGLLWGCSEKEGLVFAMDPETFEVEKYVTLAPGDDRGALARPLYLRWGDDGLLYTTAGWKVSVINPETLESQSIIGGCSLMTLDPDGNVWYAKGGGFMRIKIDQHDRLEGFLKSLTNLSSENYTVEEWNALQQEIETAKTFDEDTDEDVIIKSIRSIKALRDRTPIVKHTNQMNIMLNGESLDFDETTGVTRDYQDRTLVPIRAFLEKIGYQVTWNVHTNTYSAQKNDTSIRIVMGKGVWINEKLQESDVLPVLLWYKHYVPLRSLVEGLGYSVSFDDQSNTVKIESVK